MQPSFNKILSLCLIGLFFNLNAHADDSCILDQEKKEVAKIRSDLRSAESTGIKRKIFLAHKKIIDHDCFENGEKTKSKKTMIQIGTEAGKLAERDGAFFKEDSSDTPSAFSWYEESGLYADADRVLLKALKKAPLNFKLYTYALQLGESSGSRKSAGYSRPAAIQAELLKIAKLNADDLLQAEEKIEKGLSAPITQLPSTVISSQAKLKEAAKWLNTTPTGDQAVRKRAESRGDLIANRGDRPLVASFAEEYYRIAKSSKAEQMRGATAEYSKKMEKSAEALKKNLKEKNSHEEKAFKKGADDLEKDLGM